MALFFGLHALVHALGLTATWQVGPVGTVSASPGLVPAISAGSPLAKVLGVLWLVALAGFIAASAGLVAQVPWWKAVAASAAGVSVTLCVVWWRDAKVGAVIDLAVVAGLIATTWTAWPGTI